MHDITPSKPSPNRSLTDAVRRTLVSSGFIAVCDFSNLLKGTTPPPKPSPEPSVIPSADAIVEENWKNFWAPICCPDGKLDMLQVKRELHDYSIALTQVPRVYDHITGGRLTKPNSAADYVIAEADQHYTKCASGLAGDLMNWTAKNVQLIQRMPNGSYRIIIDTGNPEPMKFHSAIPDADMPQVGRLVEALISAQALLESESKS